MSYLPVYIAYGVVLVIFIGLAWVELKHKQKPIKWHLPDDPEPVYKLKVTRRVRQ